MVSVGEVLLQTTQRNYSCGLQYYYFTRADQTAADVYTKFVLPAGVSCQRCVMQWRWVTGNSCWGEWPSFQTAALVCLAHSFACMDNSRTVN